MSNNPDDDKPFVPSHKVLPSDPRTQPPREAKNNPHEPTVEDSNLSDTFLDTESGDHSDTAENQQQSDSIINISSRLASTASSSESVSSEDSDFCNMSHSSILKDVGQLQDSNYSSWEMRITSYLTLRDLWIDPTLNFANLTASQKAISAKAYHNIRLAVDDNNLTLISQVDNSLEAWNILRDHHAKPTIVNKTALIRSIVNQKLSSNITMQHHIIKMQQSFNELRQMGVNLDDSIQVALLFTSLTDDYESLVTGFQSWDEKNLTVKLVGNALIDAWNRKKSNSSSQQNDVSLNASRNQSANRNTFKGTSSSPVKCSFCDKFGHTIDVCRKKLRQQKRNSEHKGINAQSADDNDVSGSLTLSASAYSSVVSANRRNRRAQRENKRIFGNNHRIAHASSSTAIRSVTLQGSPTKLKSVVIKVKENAQTSTSADKASHWKLTDNDDENADVEYVIDNASPLNMSIEDVSDVDINLECNTAALLKNKNIELYLHHSFHSVTTPIKSNHWIIDSGASSHMCHDKEKFLHLVPCNSGDIKVADGNTIPIKGKGSIILHINDKNDGFKLKIDNVLYAPKLAVNLLSVKKLVERNLQVTFEGNTCNIINERNKLELGSFYDSAYRLSELSYQASIASPCLHEWHKRFAHRNIADIKRLRGLGLRVKNCECSDDCVPCIEGKMTVKSFPKHSIKPEKCLDVIVSDLCGPIQTESIGKSKYFITFTDAHSDYTEVKCIRSKSGAKQCIIEFVERLKTNLEKKPRIFRSDRGGEFIDHELQNYFKKEGIKFECTVHDSPQQNGIAERKNRTLCEAVRTMLISAKLPHSLWAEALHNAVYTFNRMIRKNQRYAPIEIFNNKIATAKFIEFGRPVYVATKQQGRRKLDNRATKMTFLSVDDISKGFRVWDGHTIRIERNVRFFMNGKSNVPYEFPLTTSHLPSKSCVDKEVSRSIPDDLLSPDIEPSISQEIPYEAPPLRRSVRLIEQNKLLATIANIPIGCDPKTYKQAITCPENEKWLEAMKQEINSIKANNTWSLVELPKDRKAIGCKWVFKIKKDENNMPIRYKARLVAQGFTQKYGVDYDEVFAPVARSTTMRILLSVAGKENLCVRQFDVTTAFLNGYLQEEIYMRQPKGFDEGEKVLKLHKSLYGLKQAARVWNLALHDALLKIGFKQSEADQCLYTFKENDSVCYVIIHVDDMLFAATNKFLIDQIVTKIGNKFELKDLGDVKHFLGIDVFRSPDGSFNISQATYIDKIATETKLFDAKSQKFPLDPGYYKLIDDTRLPDNNEYRKIIGMLLYISTNTRPDISASVCILAQRVEKPRQLDEMEAKRVIKYLCSTKNLQLRLNDISHNTALDANWAEDRTDRKSNSGVICRVFGGTVSWSSRKQNVVSTSTTEAEYYALAEATKEVQWIIQLLKNFNIIFTGPVTIQSDNQSCIKFVQNEKFSNRTKHIDVRYHYVKDLISNNAIELKYCPTEYNIADMLTKPLAGTKIKALRELAGLINIR